MSRAFWVIIGAVGGIAVYRKSTETIARARELGALGSAQAAADVTSRLAGRTAHGLGRIQDLRDRRAGRLVIGSAEEVHREAPVGASGSAATRSGGEVPSDWVPFDATRTTVVIHSEPSTPDAPEPAPVEVAAVREATPSRPGQSTAGSKPRTRRARHD